MPDAVEDIDGTRVLVAGTEGEPVRGEQDALELMAGAYYDEVHWIALPASRLTDDFFELSSGIAGQIVQKFVGYRLGFVVFGDISRFTAASESLRAFVRESNRGRQTWFLDDLDELRDRLATRPRRPVSGS